MATIVARADGIPLYAVETVRTLLADGRLVERDGVYAPKGDLSNLAVPETLTALIAARLDTLDETDRRIVHDAAVLGQSFTISALAAVSGVSEDELAGRLGSLVRRELLKREMDARSPERGQYAFVQALIREVAYNTLAKKDRKRLHLAAARYFESLDNEEIAGALASHYLAAYSNAGEGAEADALATQARIALRAAAARAIALGSFMHATNFFEQALTVTTDPTERSDLLEQTAEAAETAGRLAEAEDLWRRTIEARQELGDRVGEARAVGNLGSLLGGAYRAPEALALLDAASQRLADVDDPATVAWMTYFTAQARSRMNEYERALPLLEQALTTAEHLGLMKLTGRGLMSKGAVMLGLDRRREALGLTSAARDIFAEFGLTEYELRAIANLAISAADYDLRRGYELNAEGIALARRTGHRGILIGLIGNLGYSGFLAGEWGSILPMLDATLQEDLAPRDVLSVLNNSIIIHAAMGDDVAQMMTQLEAAAANMAGPQYVASVADAAANQALAAGDLKTAIKQFKVLYELDISQHPEYSCRAGLVAIWAGDLEGALEQMSVFKSVGGSGPVNDARHFTLLAGVAALEGKRAEALDQYREALRNWRTSGGVWDEALTGITMAQLLDQDDPEVAEVIASTRAILERLGARPYIERLDAAVARKHEAPSRSKSGEREKSAIAD